ncbi:MAG: sulfotransferase [Candidatus Dadabacteria bacterium]|nr:sulfotransferase [Candidatus Dadabacteria bacterium]
MADSPIFIVGCPRSGTKLIRDLLRSHSNITFPPESHFIPRLYKLYGNPRSENDAVKIASAILDIHWVKGFGLSLTPSSFSGCRSYGEIVSGIFREWARMEGKPRWGDKTPQYVTDIPALVEIFPDCKIIHIYRDGRDVALSLMNTWFGSGNVYSAARAWKHMMEKGRRDGRGAGPERYLELRYESLIEGPREAMEEVCEFRGEPFNETVLTPSFIESEVKPDRPGGYGTKTRILKGNHGKWRDRMPDADRAVFESVAGDILRELGYETEGRARRIAAHEKLFWTAQDYCKFIWGRRNRIGKSGWLRGELFLRWADFMGGSGQKDRR